MPSGSDGKLRLRDVIHYFPLEGAPLLHFHYDAEPPKMLIRVLRCAVEGYNSAFHFRFQLPLDGGGYIWLDLNDIDATGACSPSYHPPQSAALTRHCLAFQSLDSATVWCVKCD